MLNDGNEAKYNKIFSERLRSLRLKNNLSQQELAQKLGITRNEILRWENKQRLPTFKSLVQLADTFKVPVAIFFISSEITELEDVIKSFYSLES